MKQKEVVSISDINVANDLPFRTVWRYERAGISHRSGDAHLQAP